MLGRGGRGPRSDAPGGPRQPVPVGPLSGVDPVLGHPPQLRLPRRTGNQRARRTVEPHAQGASDLRADLLDPRRRARRRRRVRRAVQPELAPREARMSDADRSAREVRTTSCRVA